MMKALKLSVCVLLMISLVLQISCAGTESDASSAGSSAAVPGETSADVSSESGQSGVSEESEISEEDPVPTFALTNGTIEDKIKGSWAAQMTSTATARRFRRTRATSCAMDGSVLSPSS